jgi:hypothetical protein
VATVNCAVPDSFTDDGENEAVVPVGSPEALKFTVPENPFIAEIVAL